VQAGMWQGAKTIFGKLTQFVARDPYFAAVVGTTALGAGIGYGIAKYQKKARTDEFKQVLLQIQKDANTSLAIKEETVKKIGRLEAISTTHQRALISAINAYNNSLGTDKDTAEAKKEIATTKAYLVKLAGELKSKCVLPRAASFAADGALIGYASGCLAVMAGSRYFAKR